MRILCKRLIGWNINFALSENDVAPNHFSENMDEEKAKKPLLSYEQVVDMINERIERDEGEDTRDERIVRVEKAAEELETKYKGKKAGLRKRLGFFKRLWERLFRYKR